MEAASNPGVGCALSVISPEAIAGRLQAHGMEALPAEAISKLADYGNLMVRWNQRMNLTSFRQPDVLIDRQLVESVAIARLLPVGISTLMDYGSGAGLPGIPVAIVHPEIDVMLAEAHSKKAAFLREAVRVCGLSARVHAGRVAEQSGKFDAITLRAVEDMRKAVAEAGTYLLPGGSLVVIATQATKKEMLKAAGSLVYSEHPLPTVGVVLVCQI